MCLANAIIDYSQWSVAVYEKHNL